jgi:hypothetical protein
MCRDENEIILNVHHDFKTLVSKVAFKILVAIFITRHAHSNKLDAINLHARVRADTSSIRHVLYLLTRII